MSSVDPGSWVGRLAGACFTIFLASLALYGAVQIVSSILVPLSIGLAVATGGVGVWLLVRRLRGW